VTLFDRPETVAIAKKVVSKEESIHCDIKNSKRRHSRESGNPERNWIPGQARNDMLCKSINFIQGDFINDNIGNGYDLIFASQILHSVSDKENIHLLKKCKSALNTNGRIVIQEFRISKDLTQPPQSALFSVNMLVNTDGGRCYSPDEMKGWLTKLGMKNISEKPIDDSVLISAVKP